jgi:DNA gyrase subunit A
MNDLNLGPRSKRYKCAKVCGDTSGNYHPHGEQVIYPTLVRLAQPWNMRYPLVDGQGNFGSIDGDPPAAMRYTEARMTAPATEMMADLNLETVEFVANYDERLNEPTVLPAKLPNLLVNGTSGIAVGMATSIPPHNLREICDGIIHLIEHPDASVADLLKIIPGPDFPTGGMICGRAGIYEGYTNGRGTIQVRARVHSEQVKGGRSRLVVTEIPYNLSKNTIIERIARCVKTNRVGGIADVRDESDKEGMRVVIELRGGANEEVVLNQLFKHTPLQDTFSIINIALVGGRPMTLSLRDMLGLYIEHRKDVIRRRTLFLLRKARQRAHILEGLVLAVSNIDRIIELIKSSPNVEEARKRLMATPLALAEHATLRKLLPAPFVVEATGEGRRLTDVQANAILQMQLQRLTGLEIEKLATEYASLVEEINGYELLLSREDLILDIIREDTLELRDKYGDDRRTEIVGDAGELDIEDLIAEEHVVVTISHEGYIKRMPLSTYRRQGRGGKGIIGSDTKEGDFIEHLITAVTHDYLLFFTARGRVHWLKVYDIPQLSRTSKGRAVVNVLQLGSREKLAGFLTVRNFDERYVVMASRRGLVKKTPLGAFSHPKRGGIIAASVLDDDELIEVALTTGNDHIVLGTRDGYAIRFKETDVRAMGRTARGVHGIELREDDTVVDMVVADPTATLLTVCENGFGKRTELSEYRVQRRGGMGLINIRTTRRNGKVVALKGVRDSDELMMITAGGQIVRIGLTGIRTIGRATQGVRLISFKQGDHLVAVSRVAAQPTGNGDKPANPPPTPDAGAAEDAEQ